MTSSGIDAPAPISNNRQGSPKNVTNGDRRAARLPIASRILNSVGPNPRNDILNEARQ
jgi:hypothetical protein